MVKMAAASPALMLAFKGGREGKLSRTAPAGSVPFLLGKRKLSQW